MANQQDSNSAENVSGGVNINSQYDVSIQGDVVGRDKIVNVNNSMNLRNQDSWNYLYTLKPTDTNIGRVAFSPDGQVLATSSSLGSQIQLWAVKDGVLISSLWDTCGSVNDIAFSANGEVLAAACEDKAVRLWSVRHGKLTSVLREHTDEVWSVKLSKDGRRLASASLDGTIRLWKTYGNILVSEIKPPSLPKALAFYPSNSMGQYVLISIDKRGCIQLWGTEDGKLMDTLDSRFYGEVFDMTISSDDRFLAFVGYNEAHLWHLPKKEYIGAYCSWTLSI